MFGFDFHFFWQAAGAILRGGSPYSVAGFFSPYPLALLVVPFALIPFELAYGLWLALNLVLLARAGNKWGFLRAILFFPVAFDLQQGQLDLVVFLLALRMDWLGVVISTLRPQLAIWIVPFTAWQWWKAKKHDQFWKAALGMLVLYGLSTLIEPGWWSSWLHASGNAWQFNGQSASLFGLASLLPFAHEAIFAAVCILAAACFMVLRPRAPRQFWQWVALINPLANVYSLVVLFDQVEWGVILLGLAALPLSLVAHTNAVWALIPLYLIVKDRLASVTERRQALEKPAEPGA